MKTPVPSPSRKVTQSADPRVWPFLLPRGKVEAPSHEEAGPPKHASLAGGTMRKSWAVLTALKGSRRGRAVRSLLLRAQLSLGLAPRRCPSPPRKPSAEERGSAPAGSLHMPDMPCEPLGDWSPRSRPSGAGTSPCCSAWPPRCPRQRVGSAARGGRAWRVLLAGTQTADDGSARRPRRAAGGLGLLLRSPGKDPCFNFIQ